MLRVGKMVYRGRIPPTQALRLRHLSDGQRPLTTFWKPGTGTARVWSTLGLMVLRSRPRLCRSAQTRPGEVSQPRCQRRRLYFVSIQTTIASRSSSRVDGREVSDDVRLAARRNSPWRHRHHVRRSGPIDRAGRCSSPAGAPSWSETGCPVAMRTWCPPGRAVRSRYGWLRRPGRTSCASRWSSPRPWVVVEVLDRTQVQLALGDGVR